MKLSLALLCCLPLLASAAGLLGADQPCWDRKNELDALKETSGGQLPNGASYPSCDRLGRFAPQQCSGSKCFCVAPSGDKLTSGEDGSFAVNVWERSSQACRCARRQFEVRQSGVVGVFVRCDDSGDYHHTQCVGSQCHCVDSHSGERRQQLLGGEQLEAHVSKIAELAARCQAENDKE